MKTSDTTPNPEELVEAWIARAIRIYGKSENELKAYCLIAAPVVGSYKLAGTQSIAKGIRRSVSTVENHAHAAQLYKELRADGQRQISRMLFRSLPASHWWLAWEIGKSGYDPLYYLLKAHQHGWSGREMVEEYRKEREAGNAPMQIHRAKLSFYGLALELAKRTGELTIEQIAAVDAVRKAFQI